MANENQPEDLLPVSLDDIKKNAKGEYFLKTDDDNHDESEVDRLNKELESTNNQLNVANKLIVKFKKRIKYKYGQISDEDLENMADSTRFKSSTLVNYKKLGEMLGCSGPTSKKMIADRLPYLLDPKNY